MEFIETLSKGGASVALPIKSPNGLLVTKLEKNEPCFMVSLFSYMEGVMPNYEHTQSDIFWQEYGKSMGKVHSITKESSKNFNRKEYIKENYIVRAEKYIGGADSFILDKLADPIKVIESLSNSKEVYGLIHSDMHLGNLMIDDEGEIKIFDFDDACYVTL